MSEELIEFAQRFADGRLYAGDFVDEFQRRWKEERDDGRLLRDPAKKSEVLSSVFCLSDLFNPAVDREDYELDEGKLREEVCRQLVQLE